MKRILKLFKLLLNVKYFIVLVMARTAASIEHEKVLQLFFCKSVVDIGANRGQFALIARKCFPNAKIISFEPLSGPISKFKKIFCGDNNIEVHQVAIGSLEGEADIHISAREDSSSLLPITLLQNEVFNGTNEVATQKIHVSPLRKFIKPDEIKVPALLKIDVQGYELETLKGSHDLLHKFAHIYVECSFLELYEGQCMAYEVINYLDKYNFILTGIYNAAYSKEGLAVQTDFLFEQKNCKE